jgi:hypothetical protein
MVSFTRTECVVNPITKRPCKLDGKKGKELLATGIVKTWCFINTTTNRLCKDSPRCRANETIIPEPVVLVVAPVVIAPVEAPVIAQVPIVNPGNNNNIIISIPQPTNMSSLIHNVSNIQSIKRISGGQRDRKPETRLEPESIRDWCNKHYYSRVPKEWKAQGWEQLYDVYNPIALDKCLEHEEALMASDPTIWKPMVFNDLRKMKHMSIFPGCVPIWYKPCVTLDDEEHRPYGRMTSLARIGLQGIKREVRNIITEGLYHDLDIKNCHYYILSVICESNNWDCPMIRYYIENRDECLASTGLSRALAKNLYLRIMYGSKDYKKVSRGHFLYQLGDEINTIKNKMFETYPDIKQLFTIRTEHIANNNSRSDPLNSAIAIFIQDYENDCLHSIYKRLVTKNVINERVTTMMFDGLFVPIRDNLNDEVVASIVRRIRRKTNGYFSLEIKTVNTLDNFDSNGYWESFPTTVSLDIKTANRLTYERSIAPQVVFVPEEKEEDAFVSDIILECDRLPSIQEHFGTDTLFVRAKMGSGKTYQVKQYLADHPELSVCMVTFRRSLGMKYKEDLPDFHYYEDRGLDSYFTPGSHPRLIIQIDSFKRVRGAYDLVIMDEATYTLDRLYNNVPEIITTFRSYISQVDQVFVLDAYLCKQHINWFNDLRQDKTSLIIQANNTKAEGNIIMYEKKLALINAIKMDIDEDKKVIVASNSKLFLDNGLCALFTNDSIYVSCPEAGKYRLRDDPEENKEEEEKKEEPEDGLIEGKKVLLITSSDRLYSLNVEGWAEFDVVAYSPTIVAGVSYDGRDVFDKRYGYFTDGSCPATLCVQQLFRCRYPKDPTIHLCIANRSALAAQETMEIFDDMDSYLEYYANVERVMRISDSLMRSSVNQATMLSFNTFTRQFNKTPEYELVKSKIRRQFDSKMNMRGEICRLLSVQGYNYVPMITDYTEEEIKEQIQSRKIVSEMIKDKKKENKEREVRNIKIAGNILTTEYIQLKEKREVTDLSRKEIDQVNSYHIKILYRKNIEDLTDDEIWIGLNEGYYHEVDRLRGQRTASELCDYMIGVERVKQAKEHHITALNQPMKIKWAKRKYAIDILRELGFEHDAIDGDAQDMTGKYALVVTKVLDDPKLFKTLFTAQQMSKFEKYQGDRFSTGEVRSMNGFLKIVGRKISKVTQTIRVAGVGPRKSVLGYKLEHLVPGFAVPLLDLEVMQ